MTNHKAGTNKRALLFVSGGIEALPALRQAKSMGHYVVVSDGSESAPGAWEADAFLACSTYDVEGTVAAATVFHQTRRRLDGVLCVAADVPVTVAAVAAALGLPGISVETARRATDKLLMKQKFLSDGVPIPWFAAVRSPGHLAEIVAERGFPLVLKPVDSRGARGVLRLTEGVDLDWAFRTSESFSPTRRVMVEAFLSGPQISTESIVIDGVPHTPGLADRNYEYLERYTPHIIENGGELPSLHAKDCRQQIDDVLRRAVRSLGITDGVAKGDLVIHGGQPHVIEIAARPSGGGFCTLEIPMSTGVDFVGAALRLALGERIDPRELAPRFERHLAQRYLFPRPGRVTGVHGVEEVRARPHVAYCEVRVSVGDTVVPADSHPARPGFVIATGESREAAIREAEAAVGAIRIETQPLAGA